MSFTSNTSQYFYLFLFFFKSVLTQVRTGGQIFSQGITQRGTLTGANSDPQMMPM
jgi:hypothetical protein